MSVPPHAFLDLESDAQAIERFVARENARTEAALVDAAYQSDVDQAVGILEDPDILRGVARRGDWVYTFRRTKENPRGVWLRLPESETVTAQADWEPVFDLDAFCEETGDVWHWRGAVTAWFDPNRVMLRLSLGGSDQSRHLEFDCRTKTIVPEGFDLPAERSTVRWLDADTLLWATSSGPGVATSSGWPGQIRQLGRNQDPADAPILFHADPQDVIVGAYVMPDDQGRALSFFSRHYEIGKEQVTLYRQDQAHLVLPNPPDTEVWHNTTHYAYVVQEGGGTPGALMLGRIGQEKERQVFSPGPRHFIDRYSITFLRNWVLWIARDNLEPSLFALDLTAEEAEPQRIALPEQAESFWVTSHDANLFGGDETLQLHISGFLCSPRIYLFDLSQGPAGICWRKLWQDSEYFDPAGMEVRLLEARSDDGTRVPYHIVLPKGHEERQGDLPVLLYGYGGFASSLQPHYNRLIGALWLARGGAYAIAHIRGGGEFGPDWHLPAKGEGRDKAFQDFAAIASDLVERGLSRPGRIACQGGSNGGLLCGVMLTRYPERFGAVWASVGVFDMLRFHHFPAGRAWMDEYGDPDDPEAQEWLLGYSPLHRVPAADEVTLPPALIDTSSQDDRVDPSHSRRMVAALQARGHAPYFYQHGDGGHGGGGASHAQARELALGYSFLRHALGLQS